MEKILIYHHSDNDGYLAATIAMDFFQDCDLKVAVGCYDDDHDIGLLEWATEVYVLDYCLPLKLMEQYFDKIIWIDHHPRHFSGVWNIEAQVGKTMKGLRVYGKSGCLLTWEYFYGKDHPRPLVVKLINDRDVWEWKLGDDTATLHEISRQFVTNYHYWNQLLRDEDLLSQKIQEGKSIVFHTQTTIKQLIDEYAWEGNFAGYKVAFLNLPTKLSGETHRLMKQTYPNTDFILLFLVNRSRCYVNLYRTDHNRSDLDLGEIAERYGGGGHSGASGFYIDTVDFAKILESSC